MKAELRTENVHFSSSTVPKIIYWSTPNIQRLQRNFVECNVGMFRKIPPIKASIQPRKYKALHIKSHKLLIVRSETYILLIAWASCAGRNFQDNINTEMEIQQRWHTVLQVKGIIYWPFAAKHTSLVVNICVVTDEFQENFQHGSPDSSEGTHTASTVLWIIDWSQQNVQISKRIFLKCQYQFSGM